MLVKIFLNDFILLLAPNQFGLILNIWIFKLPYSLDSTDVEKHVKLAKNHMKRIHIKLQ